MVSQLLLVTSLVLFNAGSPGTPPAKADVNKAVQSSEVGDISGYYTCKGVEAGGKAYSGVAVVIKKGDVYVVQWMVGGGSTFSGVAIRQGDTLAASWALPAERGIIRGINLYRIESGPRLIGRWASSPGPGVVQSETLTFLKKLDLEE
jgi:hypothetical protein